MRVDLAADPTAISCRTVPGAPATASGSDGPRTAELSGEAAAGVESVAGDAYEVAHRLTLAQSTINAYYAACGPSAPPR